MRRASPLLLFLIACTGQVSGSRNSEIPSDDSAPNDGDQQSDRVENFGEYTFAPLYDENGFKEPDLVTIEADGTIVSRFGGRVRGRHAREVITRERPDGTPQSGHVPGSYQGFLSRYFELRVMSYELRDSSNQGGDIVLLMRTPWPHDGTNFRAHLWGGTTVASYHHNGGFEFLADESSPLPTSQEDVDRVLNGEWQPTYVYRVVFPGHNGKRTAFGTGELNDRVDPAGTADDGIDFDAFFRFIEFEVGVFLWEENGIDIGQHNYYSRSYSFKMGEPGLVAWRQMRRDESLPIMAAMDMQPEDASFIDNNGDGFDDVYGDARNEAYVRYGTPLPEEALLGGRSMTISEDISGEPDLLFMQMGLNISDRNADAFVRGRRLLHTDFWTGEHSEGANPILESQIGKAGPVLTQARCFTCHESNARSSLPRSAGAALERLVIKTGTVSDDGSVDLDPRYGTSIQQLGTDATPGEGVVTVRDFETIAGTYGDGTPYTLVRPRYTFAGGEPSSFSVRTANQFVGMGLLEAIPEETLIGFADEFDRNNDGISGRPHIVTDPELGVPRVGRYGWRAASASLRHQTADAFNADMGVTTPVYATHECSSTVADCVAADTPEPELSEAELDLMVRYMALLSVPPRRGLDDPDALAGEILFDQASCTSCHMSDITTGDVHPIAELRGQRIHPYTDLLLHDMGPELADPLPEKGAYGSEWRTAPLWGISRMVDIDPNVTYLHDGRARTLEEAILWHGGEAQSARDAFVGFSASERAQLLRFLQTL
ncbi:MAG: di-heme oxidoredictase family protein [Myxococcota bacterium]